MQNSNIMQYLKNTCKTAILALIISFSTFFGQEAFSQNLPDEFELGIRLGDTYGSDFAIDAMTPFMGETLHVNLGFNDNISVSAMYDIFDTIVDNFYWYYGFGAQVGFFDDFGLSVAAEVGIEYAVQDFPITIGVDYRPAFDILSDTDFRTNQVGFNLRYRF